MATAGVHPTGIAWQHVGCLQRVYQLQTHSNLNTITHWRACIQHVLVQALLALPLLPQGYCHMHRTRTPQSTTTLRSTGTQAVPVTLLCQHTVLTSAAVSNAASLLHTTSDPNAMRQPQGRSVPGPTQRHSCRRLRRSHAPRHVLLKPPRSDLAGSKVASSVQVVFHQLAQLSSRSSAGMGTGTIVPAKEKAMPYAWQCCVTHSLLHLLG